jgi:transposase
MQVMTIGLDLAKNVFQVHGVDARERPVLRKRLSRTKVLAFFAQLPPCRVGMEACPGAHWWARQLVQLGHDVKLMPPQYVRPYVKRNKNDAADGGDLRGLDPAVDALRPGEEPRAAVGAAAAPDPRPPWSLSAPSSPTPCAAT